MGIQRLLVNWLTRFRPASPNGSLAGSVLRTWSDSQLYAVWRATTTDSYRAAAGPRPITVAQARQLLIAEIERRYPVQTRTWLTSPAALTGEPPEFLRTGQDS
ncbi:hypothetical protein EV138_5730 [Kribbella voronezhensis]|uniref:Uncharacterized protein n=1 Tax=Kribbella voronezhensis TaxID=2512212 RepID=A0A4R7SXW2_9ACTN|nr:hypothetical protein [Kribbella voronezhensis]TDU83268.1 hypothetical protein EV138_5730 [Kribbella voronezhensis]